MTGFRLAYGGAQELFGVTPDLTCLGKIIGGGLPAAAYGASAEVMSHVSPAGPIFQAGTLSGNPLAMAAGLDNPALAQAREPLRVPRPPRRPARGGPPPGRDRREGPALRPAGRQHDHPLLHRRARSTTSTTRSAPTRPSSAASSGSCWPGASTSPAASSRPPSSPPPTPRPTSTGPSRPLARRSAPPPVDRVVANDTDERQRVFSKNEGRGHVRAAALRWSDLKGDRDDLSAAGIEDSAQGTTPSGPSMAL